MQSKKSVKSIKSGFLRRNFSLARLSAQTAVSLVGKKQTDAIIATLKSQAHKWVKEMSVMKGPLMKVGQVLTMIDDAVIPKEIKDIFRPLMDQSVELDGKVIERYLRQRLKSERMNQLDFDLTPYASASIGQVHRAIVKQSNDKVVIKIQYPGMQRCLDSDMKTLRSFFTALRVFPGFSREIAEGLLDEVRSLLEQEMDYLNEAKNIEYYRNFFSDHEQVVVPKVLNEFTTKTVLTMSYESGEAMTPEVLKALSETQANTLAMTLIDLFLKEVFSMGVLQTDTHAANYRIRTLGHDKVELVLLDFGAIKALKQDLVEMIRILVHAVYNNDSDGLTAHLYAMGLIRKDDHPVFVDLHLDVIKRSIGAILPKDHPINAKGVIRLNSPEWFEYMDHFKSRLASLRFLPKPREIDPELLSLGRWALGMRQFLSEIPAEWDELDIESLVLKYLPELEET